jgi:hypothetical protein
LAGSSVVPSPRRGLHLPLTLGVAVAGSCAPLLVCIVRMDCVGPSRHLPQSFVHPLRRRRLPNAPGIDAGSGAVARAAPRSGGPLHQMRSDWVDSECVSRLHTFTPYPLHPFTRCPPRSASLAARAVGAQAAAAKTGRVVAGRCDDVGGWATRDTQLQAAIFDTCAAYDGLDLLCMHAAVRLLR